MKRAGVRLNLALVLGSALLPACMSTKVVLNPEWEPSSPPVYVDYFDYYWFGFQGHSRVDLDQVCMDQKPHAIQHVKSFEDGVITTLTLGIYSPLTVKVWCGD
ncbi:MAG: hypothetical protein AB7G93_17610 [Bdellovibrionales bacterium]